MAVYYSIKCPHCNYTVEQGKDRSTKYGSPFKTCPRCKNIYVDNNFIEPALLDNSDFKKFSWGSIPLILIGAGALYFVVTEFNIVALIVAIFSLIVGVVSLVSSLKYNPEKDGSLQIAIKESQKRLSDPHYVIALWKAGGHITRELLDWAKENVDSSSSLTDNNDTKV